MVLCDKPCSVKTRSHNCLQVAQSSLVRLSVPRLGLASEANRMTTLTQKAFFYCSLVTVAGTKPWLNDLSLFSFCIKHYAARFSFCLCSLTMSQEAVIEAHAMLEVHNSYYYPFTPHISKWLSVADVDVYRFASLTHTEGAFTSVKEDEQSKGSDLQQWPDGTSIAGGGMLGTCPSPEIYIGMRYRA